MFQAEYETKLNRVCLHISVEKVYEEDYQMPMLRQNPIPGILEVEGSAVDGKSRYTYEIGGFTSMKTLYEKTSLKKQTIEEIVTGLLAVVEELQEFMLNPNCLILNPEYIFFRSGQWYFCYLPGLDGEMEKAFHELTEYFVKTLDYEDTEGIFLAYELHKASLQEHYDLHQIMKAYKEHETERKQRPKEDENGQSKFGNVFSLTEEEDLPAGAKGAPYQTSPMADVVREEGWRGAWKSAAKKIRDKRWGSWEDLILESGHPSDYSER